MTQFDAPRAVRRALTKHSLLRSTLAFRLILGVMLLLGLAAEVAAQTYRIPAGYASDVIQVKLEEGRSPSQITTVLPDGLRSKAARIQPLFTVAPEKLAQLKAEGERRSGTATKDLRLWFEIRLAPGTDAAAFVEALRATPGVAFAEPAPLPAPPPSALATTPSFVANQGYLEEATDGINAEFAWTIPGGNGAGITIYDVEYSWNQSHEDLSKAAGVSFLLDAGDTAADPFSDNNHGTAVLGEVIADNDAKGVTGISWGASIGLAPANTDDLGYNPANAIALAVADGSAGDVILIEQQTCVCDIACPGMGSQFGFGPSEWIQSVFDATQAATAAGFVVVAAAGNGSADLDQEGCDDKFDRGTRDSGAIIVGAGGSPTFTDRQRLGFSSYGSRVDLQGWGTSVWTTGYGTGYTDPDAPSNPNRWYANSFGGTSSASPIVTGAVADLQGIALADPSLPLFTASAVRNLLVATGSPQLGNTAQHIGPRPNLRAAIAEVINLAPTADAGLDQTVECASYDGASVTLNGSGSEDLNGDALTYTWREGSNVIATGISPTVTLALGTHTIELTVDDGNGETDTDEVVITVEDTTGPVVTLNGLAELTLECHVDDYVELGATATDICDPSPSLVTTGTVDTHAPGDYEVVYTATDASDNEASETRTVHVVDTTPPEITVNAAPMSLHPPNHKYHEIALDDLDIVAEDLCDLDVSADDVVIASVESDEAEEVPDPGDGETYDDIVIGESCQSVEVRAERGQNGNGRVYTLRLEVADASGNVGTASYEVHVPKNRRFGPLAVADTPALYTVEGCEPAAAVAVATEKQEEEADTAADDRAKSGEGSGVAAASVGASKASAELPVEYVLDQNYPNPFGAATQIRFGLPESGPVRLEVFDLVGRRVAVLADATFAAGYHSVRWDAGHAANGVYLYKLTAGSSVEVRRLTLQR